MNGFETCRLQDPDHMFNFAKRWVEEQSQKALSKLHSQYKSASPTDGVLWPSLQYLAKRCQLSVMFCVVCFVNLARRCFDLFGEILVHKQHVQLRLQAEAGDD